ncbi:uncharacterized protein EI97DRAFT_376100 [Westerdykella ornata]|uniref:Uncharacterized protein n=1 Tax=Westerdykella ornata TaxID=318751 RepID=A0A6A6JKN3_WESOR|nr:uncharacterized protein EI97DRAFT_376100 [Westerdykella ornata]KAF2277042.1 hypothetical protein EI97DRAFT_376100 [Westerdykella ornata]
MLLQSGHSLAEAADLSPEQLESLARSIEQKKQRLEDDIREYIRRKQDELRHYERELVKQYRSMESSSSSSESHTHAVASDTSSPSDLGSPPTTADLGSTDRTDAAQEEAGKRTKYTRVHKREKELCGLVTPLYLPLLEAQPQTVKKRKEKKRQKEKKSESLEKGAPALERGTPSQDPSPAKEYETEKALQGNEKAEQAESSGAGQENMAAGSRTDADKKSKRSAIRKSSLRHSNSKSRRKRVSLIVDDQIVHPADNITESQSTTPSETTASNTSASTPINEENIDPLLLDAHVSPNNREPVHHSLPFPIHLPSTSPTKHTGHMLTSPSPTSAYPTKHTAHSLTSPSSTSAYLPPQTVGRTYLDPSPPGPEYDHIISHSPSEPIYADRVERIEQQEEDDLVGGDLDSQDFDTYVGGLSGSGVDNVNQSNSYGYPSSLGASYLESYMKSRPLSVRIAAAEKAELEEHEKRELLQDHDNEEELHSSGPTTRDEIDEDMEVIGSLEGF